MTAAGSSIGLTIPDNVCTVLCSWWWVEELPETCRAIYRNKQIEKTLHLVGCTLEIYLRCTDIWTSNLWVISRTLLKTQDSHDLHFSLGGTKNLSKAYVYQYQKGMNPLSVLLYSILSIPVYVPFFSPLTNKCTSFLPLLHKIKWTIRNRRFKLKIKKWYKCQQFTNIW